MANLKQGRNSKGQFLSFEETEAQNKVLKVDQAKMQGARVDTIREQQDTGKLAQKLIAARGKRFQGDRGGKGGIESAQQFAEMNNTFNILSKTMGDYKSTSENELKTLESLVDITKEAEFSSAKDQKKLLEEVGTQIEILQKVEGHDDPNESPILAEALKTQKLLQDNSKAFTRFGEFLGDSLIAGLGALTGVVGNSPLLAMGVQFAGTKIEEARERKKTRNDALRDAARASAGREIDTLAESSEVVDLSPEIIKGELSEGVREGATNELIDQIANETDPEIKAQLELIFEALMSQGGVVDVIKRVEDQLSGEHKDEQVEVLVDIWEELEKGNVEALNQYKRQRRDAEEARRDAKAKATTMQKGSKETLPEEEEEPNIAGVPLVFTAAGLLGMAKSIVKGLFAALLFTFSPKAWKKAFAKLMGTRFMQFGKGLLKNIVKGLAFIFNAKTIGFMLKKALPIAAIGYSLFTGGKEAIEEYQRSGDIGKAVQGFFGQVAETMTFGLLSKENLSKWGSEFGMWVEDKITAFSDGVKGLLDGPLDRLRALGEEIASWFAWMADIDIRDFLPENMITLMEKAGVLDTKEEKATGELADAYERETTEALVKRGEAQGWDEKDIDALVEGAKIQIEADARRQGMTVEELMAMRQQDIMEQRKATTATVLPFKRDEAADIKGMTDAIEKSSLGKLDQVVSISNDLDQRVVQRQEEQKRKTQQPTVNQQNNTSNTQNSTIVTQGGPSDPDAAWIAEHNRQSVG